MRIEKELSLYIIFGVLTTIVNIFVYLFFARICGIDYIISNIIAWFLSVLFAYVTNRIWVFESKKSNIVKESLLFFGGRLFSGILDTGLMYLFVDILLTGDLFAKIVVQIIVVIVNYLFSKLVVFGWVVFSDIFSANFILFNFRNIIYKTLKLHFYLILDLKLIYWRC